MQHSNFYCGHVCNKRLDSKFTLKSLAPDVFFVFLSLKNAVLTKN